MASVYIVEQLQKKGISYEIPLFVYNLSGDWQTSTALGEVLANDGAERYEVKALVDAQDIAESKGWPTRVRRVNLNLAKIKLDKLPEIRIVSE